MLYLSLFCGYVVTSALVMIYPSLLHKKKRIKFKARNISHAGGAGERIGNTLAAFEHARDVGSDMLELDCHLTRDGHVVVSHDNRLSYSTNSDILISETDYKDLPKLKTAIRPSYAFNTVVSGVVGEGSLQIPLLRDVFDKFQSMPINIDIKIDNDELIKKVASMVHEYKREEITVWGNAGLRITNKCYKESPDLYVLFSRFRVIAVLLLFYLGLLPFCSLHESFFEVVMPNIILRKGKYKKNYSWITALVVQIGDFILMNRVLFHHLKARGIQVYIWVLNEEADWLRAFEYGADGVMTDYPTALQAFLSTYPSPSDQRSTSK